MKSMKLLLIMSSLSGAFLFGAAGSPIQVYAKNETNSYNVRLAAVPEGASTETAVGAGILIKPGTDVTLIGTVSPGQELQYKYINAATGAAWSTKRYPWAILKKTDTSGVLFTFTEWKGAAVASYGGQAQIPEVQASLTQSQKDELKRMFTAVIAVMNGWFLKTRAYDETQWSNVRTIIDKIPMRDPKAKSVTLSALDNYKRSQGMSQGLKDQAAANFGPIITLLQTQAAVLGVH